MSNRLTAKPAASSPSAGDVLYLDGPTGVRALDAGYPATAAAAAVAGLKSEVDPFPQYSATGTAAVYVDSVSGNDNNSGLNSSSPKKTLAGVTPLLSDRCTVRLARGSYFRDSLVANSFSGISVEAYGAGNTPVVDCSNDLQSGDFTRQTSGGETHTWKATITLGSAGWMSGKQQPSCWDNLATGSQMVRMRKVASVALVESTANTFYYTGTGGVSGTLYVHTNSGTAPLDSQVSVAVRDCGIWLGTDAMVSGVVTKRQLHNDGSLVVGRWSVIADCDCLDGSYHNLLIGSGKLQRVRGLGIGHSADYGGGSCSPFAYYFVGTGTESVEMLDCEASYGLAVDGSRVWVPSGNETMHTAHVDGGGSYDKFRVENCHATNFGGIYGNLPELYIAQANCVWDGCLNVINGGVPKFSDVGSVHIDKYNSWAQQYKIETASESDFVGTQFSGGPSYSTGVIWLRSGSTGSKLNLVGCRADISGSAGQTFVKVENGVSLSLTGRGNTVLGSAGGVVFDLPASGITFDLRKNSYWTSAQFVIGEASTNLSGWKTTTSTDADSVAILSGLGSITVSGSTGTISAGGQFNIQYDFPGALAGSSFVLSRVNGNGNEFGPLWWSNAFAYQVADNKVRLVIQNVSTESQSLTFTTRISGIA